MSDATNGAKEPGIFITKGDLAAFPKVGYERQPMAVNGLYVPPEPEDAAPEPIPTQAVVCMAADRPFATHRHCTAHRTTRSLCVDCWRRH